MRLTLGLTGMDPATETALQAAFQAANNRLGGRWQMVPDTQADYVVIDMDSMYGPMSWLRLHAAGKSVIALTASPRSQADFRLANPFDAHSVGNLLHEIGTQAGASFDQAPAIIEPPVAVVVPVQAPEITPAIVPEPAPTPAPDITGEVTSTAIVATPVVATVSTPAAIPPIRPGADTLLAWLGNNRLTGRVRVRGDESVLIDVAQRIYHGPAALKPLSALFESELSAADFISIDAATWDSESGHLGAAMPLVRLVWFGSLLAGKGTLAPEHDPQRRYHLIKWPQTEREYPKHFRIATVMMKGPALIAEIAEASSVPAAEVTDFINANLATGFAEVEREQDSVEAGKSGSGLFGRLRGR